MTKVPITIYLETVNGRDKTKKKKQLIFTVIPQGKTDLIKGKNLFSCNVKII